MTSSLFFIPVNKPRYPKETLRNIPRYGPTTGIDDNGMNNRLAMIKPIMMPITPAQISPEDSPLSFTSNRFMNLDRTLETQGAMKNPTIDPTAKATIR